MEIDDPRPQEPQKSSNLPSNAKINLASLTDRQRVEIDKYDTEAWESILDSATREKKLSETYEEILQVFPTAGLIWNKLVQHEISRGRYDKVDEIFKRSLLSCLSVELWRSYLLYSVEATRKTLFSDNEPKKEKIKKIYEYAIGHIGLDTASTPIWQDYIAFLKDEAFDSRFVLSVYVRALGNPMQGLESLWKDYEQFAAKLHDPNSAEISGKHATAKRVFDERSRHTEGITKNTWAKPPRNNINDIHQAKLWKQLIDYEKSNPQDLDSAGLSSRVSFTYNQALTALYHYPEIWYQAAVYQSSIGNHDNAKGVFKNALKVLDSCLLMHFLYCDYLELHNEKSVADERYRLMIDQFKTNVLVWIQYMHFCRRVFGKEAARKSFFKARKQLGSHATYHIYIAAAEIEYYINRDDTAARTMYEFGYQNFDSDISFLRNYIQFLFHQNEASHMRVLFEKSLRTLPISKALEIWNMFIEFENRSGNLETAYSVQTRRTKAYPKMDPSGILASVQRYRFMDIWPCSNPELQSFANSFDIEGDLEEAETAEGENAGNNQGDGSDTVNGAAGQIMILPDVKQMQLYKGTGTGGQVATSSTLSIRLDELMMKLPSARDWSGPMVNIELLMQSIQNFIDMPVAIGLSRFTRLDEEDENEMQIQARESAMAHDQFRRRIAKFPGSRHH